MWISGSAAVVQHDFIPSLRQTSSAPLYQYPPLFFFFPCFMMLVFYQIRKTKPLLKNSDKTLRLPQFCVVQPQLCGPAPPPLLSQVLEPVQGTAEPSGRIKISCSVRSLSVQFLAWLTERLRGARARGKRGNVTKGGGILP